jgi:5-methylcytosine-specific restriction endonuclease McrA
MKTCTKCGVEKCLEEFRKVTRLAFGRDCYCKECRRQIARDWTAANIEKERARNAKYKAANAEQVRERSRLHMRAKRAVDPEAEREYTRRYREQNPDRAVVWDQRKRAKRKAAPGVGINKDEWKAIKDKYKNHCVYCMKPFKRLTMDHVVPLAKGGEHSPDNIVPACKPCNNSKHARDLYTWVMEKHQRLI